MTTSDTPRTGWISMRHLQHMVARGEAAGIRVDELLDEAGLSRGRLADADGLVPLTAVEAMFAGLSRRYADPLIGLHLASDIQPATFGAIGMIFQACTTFSDVLDVAVRFSGLLSNIGRTSVVHAPGLVEVRWECLAGGPAFRRQAGDYVMGAFVVLARLLVPESERLLRSVNFPHPRPDDAARSREYFDFFRVPVHFDRPLASVVLSAEALKLRLHHGDALIKDLLERHAQELLRQRAQARSLPDDVQRLVAAMTLDGIPTRDMVAQQLGVSSRSLHRKLQEAGTSYREILDSVRLRLAHERLLGSSDSIADIAACLGFSSHQAFLRWFRDCTGHTPGEFRKRQATARET